MRFDRLVHSIWRKIQITRPRHSTALDVGLLKDDWIFQCFEDTRQVTWLELNLANGTISELHAQCKRRYGFDIYHIPFHDEPHFKGAIVRAGFAKKKK